LVNTSLAIPWRSSRSGTQHRSEIPNGRKKIQLPLRKLGNTDIDISAMGLGTWQFSGGTGLIGGYWDALDSELIHANRQSRG
jgi:hypothetical protein